MSPTIAEQFNRAVDLAVILIIVPYIYSVIALINLLAIHHVAPKTFRIYLGIGLTALVYSLWAVVGGDEHTVVNAFVALMISVPLYLFVTRRTQPAMLRQPVVAPPAPLDDMKGTHARTTT
jgi:arginine:agmatine antiporter